MGAIRVLVVDDHLVVRRGLRDMLSGVEDIQVVGDAGYAGEAMEQVRSLHPDVVLLDIRMPDIDGLRLIRSLRQESPAPKIIMLTMYDDEQFVLEAFRAGAQGYLLKNIGREDLLAAVRTVARGRRMLASEMLDSVLKQYSELGRRQVVSDFGLSAAEVELLRMVGTGATNRQIAENMHWSEATVKRKLSDVFGKLDVCDRAQAIAVAMQHSLL